MDTIARIPAAEADLRRFLDAQFNWERYHRARLTFVHAAAAAALALWVLAALRAAAPAVLLFGCAACFLAAAFAAMMEWRWQKRRDRCAGEMGGGQ